MSDTDATQARRDVVADVDEVIEHVINANMLNMPYDVYSELFDAVDGLGVEIENLQAENDKLRELVKRMFDRVSYECRCCSVFCSDWDEDNECCVFTTLMRELKVERWTDEPIRADSC